LQREGKKDPVELFVVGTARLHPMRVIFHGDDFGLTRGINQGIIDAFKRGLLTSASIVTTGEAVEDALRLAREHPGLDLGVHLVLCDERPLLPYEYISSILSSNRCFLSRQQLLFRILTRKINGLEVRAEWSAQIEKVLNEGISLSHLDGHQYLHLYPGLLHVTLKLAKEYGIPFVRGSIVDRLDLESGTKRLVQWAFLKFWTVLNVSRLDHVQVRRIPSVGFLKSGGRMTRKYVLETVDLLRRKGAWPVIEMNFHPGTGDPHTSWKYQHWHYDWKSDLDLLIDESLKNALLERGVVLSSFGKENGRAFVGGGKPRVDAAPRCDL